MSLCYLPFYFPSLRQTNKYLRVRALVLLYFILFWDSLFFISFSLSLSPRILYTTSPGMTCIVLPHPLLLSSVDGLLSTCMYGVQKKT